MEYRHRWGMSRDRRRHPGYSAPPTNLTVGLTYRCNLQCKMCRQWRRNGDIPKNHTWYDWHRELPVSVWASLLEQVAPFRPWLYLTGGETLIYPEFKQFVQEANLRGLKMHLQTNGTLLAGVAEFLVQAGVLTVSVSLDGPPEVHDHIRGVKGAFRRLAEGRIKLLFMPNLPEKFLSPYYLDLDYPFPQHCDVFWKTLRVLPDGTVSPCLNLKLGNIVTDSFTEIWNGPKM